jgi:glycosyltransferase involved in cell wall biosynthesis
MRILIVAQYFFTPEQAGSARLHELGRRLVGDGHQVTLVTGMVDNAVRRVPEAYRGRVRVREEIGGMRVLRVWAYPHYRQSHRGRLVHYATFNLTSLLALLEGRGYDLVLATSPPLTAGISGWLLARYYGAPLVFEVRDLWPQAAVRLGALRGRRAIALAEGLERFLYRHASRLLALTPGIGRYLVEEAGVAAERVAVVTNGFDPEAFRDLAEPRAGRRALGIEAGFLVVQAGSIGPSDHLEVLIDAAARLRDERDLRFLIVGEGDGRAALEQRAQTLGLANVEFRDPVARREVGRFYAAADLLICHIPAFYTPVALSNRFLDYLGTGRPIICTGPGDMADALARCGGGVAVPPDDPEAMAEAIRKVYRGGAPPRTSAVEAAALFSWDAVYARYRAALLRAAAAPAAASAAGAAQEKA